MGRDAVPCNLVPGRNVSVEVLELPFPPSDPGPAPSVEATSCRWERSPFGTFDECPMCGGGMAPEHAHFRCTGCGWRDSCCD
jgi:hypothetical protein